MNEKYDKLFKAINDYLDKDGIRMFWKFVEEKVGEKLMDAIPEDDPEYQEKIDGILKKIQDSSNEDLLYFY